MDITSTVGAVPEYKRCLIGRKISSGRPRFCSNGAGADPMPTLPENEEMTLNDVDASKMHIPYLVITVVFALMVSYSAVGKIRRHPLQVRVIHETVGVPLKYFPLLAACEFAGALGLVVGIWIALTRISHADSGKKPLLLA